MWKLWLGIILFAGPHLFSILLPDLRNQLKARLGEKPYKSIYALASLAGLVFLVLGYLASYTEPGGLDLLYEPLFSLKHLTYLLTLLGFILLGASHGKGHIKHFVRHPMSLGIMLWSVGHLLMNGEKSVVIIFGMFFILGILDFCLSLMRGKRPVHEPRIRSDVIAIVSGTVLWLLLALLFHPYVIGIPVVG